MESFGQPGQRTFRILAETPDGRISVWLEKEQIVVLGSAIDDLLARVLDDAHADSEPAAFATFVGELEVKAGALAIGFDPQLAQFSVEASDFESAFELDALAFALTRRQFVALREQIADIVSRSRPRCVLCGTPLTGDTHFCPPSNGHAKLDA